MNRTTVSLIYGLSCLSAVSTQVSAVIGHGARFRQVRQIYISILQGEGHCEKPRHEGHATNKVAAAPLRPQPRAELAADERS